MPPTCRTFDLGLMASPASTDRDLKAGSIDLKGRPSTPAVAPWYFPPRRQVFRAAWLVITLLTAGCAGLERSPSAPLNLADQSTVLGIPNARFYADTQGAAIAQEALRAIERERAALPTLGGREAGLPPANLLALSGGSDDGAFGAGLLVGWTEAGTRPEFKLVSGISTGSLIAPFAFLGSAYDPQLRADRVAHPQRTEAPLAAHSLGSKTAVPARTVSASLAARAKGNFD